MKTSQIYHLTTFLRLSVIFLQLFLAFLHPLWMLKTIHYFVYPMGGIFSSPSLIPQNLKKMEKIQYFDITRTAFNIGLILAFFLQHVIMASVKFKALCKTICETYPIYERLIYNILSSILLYLVLDLQQPQYILMFQLPMWMTLPLFLIGISLYVDANIRMEQPVFFPYNFSTLLTGKTLEVSHPNYQNVQPTGITMKGSYSMIRHPMLTGLFLLLIFGSPIFTLEKIIMTTLMGMGIYMGVIMEENRLVKRYAQYSDYMKRVRSKFIPYLL